MPSADRQAEVYASERGGGVNDNEAMNYAAMSGGGGGMGMGSQAGAGMGSTVGGLIGMIASNSDRQNAKNSANAAIDELMSVGLPPDLSNPVAIKHLQSVGLYTPQLEQAINLGVTQGEQITEDPELKAQQLRQMSALENLSKRGFSPAQIADLTKQNMLTERNEQARQQSLIQNMQARGQGGGGAEIAARLQSSQDAANRQSQAGLDATGASSQAAMNALQQLGSVAGNVRSQDYGVAKDKAAAADLRNRFNTQAAMTRQTTNVGAQNQGQERNLERAEKVSDTNVALDNQELLRQNQAKRQYWEDQAARSGMRAGALQGRSKIQTGSANDTSGLWGGIGTALGGAAGAAFGGG